MRPSRNRSSAPTRVVCALSVLSCIVVAGTAGVMATSAQQPSGNRIEVLPVRGNVFMLVVGDVNVTAQVGDQGVLLVDTAPAAFADALMATVEEHFGRPVRIVINTHSDPDHTGGNAALAGAAGGRTGFNVAAGAEGLRIIAHENTLLRMANGADAVPQAGWPTSTFFGERKDLYFNGEPIEILHQPSATTDGDVIVFFRGSDVISAGDLFNTDRYAMFDPSRGGSIQGVLAGLGRLLDMTIPEFNQSGGTRVVSGHGRIGNEADVDDYHNWTVTIRDRVRDMVRKRMTLDQVKAARPTLDFDGVFDHPDVTPARFIELLFDDLSRSMGTR